MITMHDSKTADIRLKKDLLLFFQNYHPYAKFSAGVLSYAVRRTKKANLEEVLEALVIDELIEKHTNQQGQLFYCLTTDPQKRESCLRLFACNDNGNEECNQVSAFSSSQMVSKFGQFRLGETVSI